MQTNSKTLLPADWALLVVDMQNDFLDKGGYYAQRAALEERPSWGFLSSGEQLRMLEDAGPAHALGMRSFAVERMVANVCAAIATARRAGRPIAFVRAVYDPSFDRRPPLLTNHPGRRHFPCRPGTWGADFVDAIADATGELRRATERIIEKHIYDAFTDPALPAFLQETLVHSVVVCGTETQVCVLTSAQSAALLGFRTFILEDCVWSANAGTAGAALSIFRDAYGGTLTLDELGAPVASC